MNALDVARGMRLGERVPAADSIALSHAAAKFAQTEHAKLWARYPDLNEDEHAAVDACACESMSVAFAAAVRDEFAFRRRPVRTRILEASECADPLVWTHRFVEVAMENRTVFFDWTARQFYDVEGRIADPPTVAIWSGSPFDHPTVTFGKIEVVAVAS